MTSFWKSFFVFFLVLGAYMPTSVVFAGTCVCTTNANDCQAAFLPLSDESQASCETICKKNLADTFSSAEYAEDVAGEILYQQCTIKHQSFQTVKSSTTPPKAPKTETITPKLNVEIPGLQFSPAVIGAETIKTNFLADYLNAVYVFLIGSASIIAIVMIMIGGLQYTIGAASPTQVGKGKERIKNALTGLILLLCVFLVLKTTNPQLVILKMIELQNVQPVEFDFGPETVTEAEIQQSTSAGPYQFKYFTNCPVPLTNPITYKDENQKKPGDIRKNIPRRAEFHEKIRSLITGTISERIIKSVEAATQCKIQYENCGVGTTNIYALAAKSGTYGDTCLQNTNPAAPCNILGFSRGNIRKKMIHDVSSAQTSYGMKVSQLLIGFYCPSVAKCKSAKWPEPCIQDKTQAANKLTSVLTATGKWSPEWINELQPGDYYMVVNWNPSCQSTHSAMFLGWQDKANKIATVEMADAANFLRIGTKKFSPEDIVIQISRPIE